MRRAAIEGRRNVLANDITHGIHVDSKVSSKLSMVVERQQKSRSRRIDRGARGKVMICAHLFLGPNDEQDDLNNGAVNNVARAVGYGPRKSGSDGENRSSTEAEASAWVNLPQHASLQVCSAQTWARTSIVHEKIRA